MARYALVIGVAKYDHYSPNLPKAAGDAEAIAALLEEHGYNVSRLPKKLIAENQWTVDPEARLKYADLRQEVKSFLQDRAHKHEAIIYFAGHGMRVLDPFTDEPSGFLMASDTTASGQQGVPLTSLNALIRKSDLSSLVLLLDCCYAGSIVEQRSLLEATRSTIDHIQNYRLIAACRDFERAREGKEHGVFTAAVLGGLSPDNARQGEVRFSDLLGYVSRELDRSGQEVISSGTGLDTPLVHYPHLRVRPSPIQPQAKSSAPILFRGDIETFTGRDQELQKLCDLLLVPEGRQKARLAFVVGAPAVGKSTLAYHFATLHQEAFEKVIGWPVSENVNDTAREFARKFGEKIDEDDERDAVTIMQEVFAPHRVLLIFDNVDHLEPRDIQKLIPRSGECCIVFTTRDRKLPFFLKFWEHIVELTYFENEKSQELLEKLIGSQRMLAEPDATQTLLKLASNLPLAIQIVGTNFQYLSHLDESYSLDHYVNSINNKQLLNEEDDQQNIHAVFSLSLNQLSLAEAHCFASLGVCAENGFSLQTAMAASGWSHEEETRRFLLQRLCRLSLLIKLEGDRYVFHSLIRLFAQDKAQEFGVREDAARRHAHYFVNRVAALENPASEESTIEADLDDIILAAKWLQAHRFSNYQAFAENLNSFFEKYNNHWQQAANVMAGFKALAGDHKDWENVVTFCTREAKYHALLGDLETAEQVLNAVPNLLDKISVATARRRSEVKWLLRLGSVLQRQNRSDEALQCLRQSEAIARELGDLELLRNTLNSLGSIFHQQKLISEAAQTFEEVVELSNQLQDHYSAIRAIYRLGDLLQQQGQLERASNALREGICLSTSQNNQKMVAIGLHQLGNVLYSLGRKDEALQHFQESRTISRETGNQRTLAIASYRMGVVLKELGRLDEAVEMFDEQIAACEHLEYEEDQRLLAIGLFQQGEILKQQKKLVAALEKLHRAVQMDDVLENVDSLLGALRRIGSCFYQQKQFLEATQAFQDVVTVSERAGGKAREHLASGLNRLGLLLQEQGRFAEAQSCFERQIALGNEKNNLRQVMYGHNSLGGLMLRQGRLDEALDALVHGIALNRALAKRRSSGITLHWLNQYLQAQGDFEEVLWAFQRQIEHQTAKSDLQKRDIALYLMSRLIEDQNKLEDTLTLVQGWIHAGRDVSCERAIARTLYRLSQQFQEKKSLEKAETALRMQIRLSEAVQDQEQVAAGYLTLGEVLKKMGQLEAAQHACEDAIAHAHQTAQLVNGYYQLGAIVLNLKQVDQALQAFQRSIELSRAAEIKRSLDLVVQALCNRRDIYPDIKQSLQRYSQTVQSPPKQQVIVHHLFGRFLQHIHQQDDAGKALEQSLELSRALDEPEYLAIGLGCLGDLWVKQGREEAEALLLQSVKLCETLEASEQLALRSLYSLGKLYKNQGNIDRAIAICEHQIQIIRTIDNPRLLAESLMRLGGLWRRQGHLDNSLNAFLEAAQHHKNLKDLGGLIASFRGLAPALQQQGKLDKALEAVQCLISISQGPNYLESKAIGLNRLGKIQHAQGKLDEAFRSFQNQIVIGETTPNPRQIVEGLNGLCGLIEPFLNAGLRMLQQVLEIENEDNIPSRLSSPSNSTRDSTYSQRLNKILHAFQQAIYIDDILLCKRLIAASSSRKTLAHVLRRGKMWQRIYDDFLRPLFTITERSQDLNQQALVCYITAQVLHKQKGKEALDLVRMHFRKGIELASHLENQDLLAQLHRGWGAVLVVQGELEQAHSEFLSSVNITIHLKNASALELVLPDLAQVLVQLNLRDEALGYCERAIAIAPKSRVMLDLFAKLSDTNIPYSV